MIAGATGSIRKPPDAEMLPEASECEHASLARVKSHAHSLLGSIKGNHLDNKAKQALQRAAAGRDVKIEF